MEISSSPKWKLNGTDWSKTLRGMAVTFVGGAIVEMMMKLYAMLEACKVPSEACQLDLGVYNVLIPLFIAVVGGGLELFRRWLTNYSN